MSAEETQLRRALCSASLGYTAYHSWAVKARQERRFNISRLLEASSNVKRVKAERAFQQLGEVGTTADNIARALAGLEPETIATGPVTGTSALSRELLGRAVLALAEERDLRADELGDLYVCGSCGEMFEGMGPEICSVCGTVREGFLAFTAAESMGTRGPHGIMHALERSTDVLRALLDGVDDSLLTLHPGPGKPSMKELAGHLIDTDGVFRERAWLILETESPELPLAHPPRLTNATIYQSQTAAEIMETFQSSRRQTLSLMRGLTSAAWHRTGHHETLGTVPLTHQGNWVVSHERSHLIELAQMRHDLLAGNGAESWLPPQLVPEVLEGE
jgi:rubrerythrin